MRVAAMLAVFVPLAWAQSTPQSLVDAFLSRSDIRDKRAVYTGDMLSFLNERTLGQQLPKNAKKQVRSLSSSESAAIFAIEITADGATQDWYAFVRLEQGVWKLAAIRSLSLSGLASDAQLRADLRARIAEFDAIAEAVRRGESSTACTQLPGGAIDCVQARGLRNAAGYLYVPDGTPPPMSPDEWMYIEHVAGRWYVFKRT